jgi:putative transposase
LKNLTDLNELSVLTDKETLEEVVDCLAQHISIDTKGAFNQTDLFNILVRAASQADNIENTASTLKQVPGGNNIRYHLSKINSFEQLETQFNLALAHQIPRGI